jgi:hypothetical protein
MSMPPSMGLEYTGKHRRPGALGSAGWPGRDGGYGRVDGTLGAGSTSAAASAVTVQAVTVQAVTAQSIMGPSITGPSITGPWPGAGRSLETGPWPEMGTWSDAG